MKKQELYNHLGTQLGLWNQGQKKCVRHNRYPTMSLKNYNSALADSVTCNNYAPSSAIFTFSLLIQSTQHSLFIVLLILLIVVFIILTWRLGHHGWRSYFWLLFVLCHFLQQKQYYCSFTTGVLPRITCFFF